MGFRFERTESRRPTSDANRTPSNVWDEVNATRRSTQKLDAQRRTEGAAQPEKKQEKKQEKTEQVKKPNDAAPKEQEAQKKKANPNVLDFSQNDPLKKANLARSEMRDSRRETNRESRRESNSGSSSGALTRAEAAALRNFDPNKPMSERTMDALQKLRARAMEPGADGKPLWTSYAPSNSEARSVFKNQLFGGNVDYENAHYDTRSGSEWGRREAYSYIRNYGESYEPSTSEYSPVPINMDAGMLYR